MDEARVPLANVVILGALDLVRLRDFYRQLGWPQVVDEEVFAAFELRGAVLAIFDADKLAANGNTDAEAVRRGIRFALGIMADTPVDSTVTADGDRGPGGTAQVFIRGHALMRNIRRGHYEPGIDARTHRKIETAFSELARTI
jgi:hypothetical protein